MLRLSGLATVTLGAGAAACLRASPQPASRHAKASATAGRDPVYGSMSPAQKHANAAYIEAEAGRAWRSRVCDPFPIALAHPISARTPQVHQPEQAPDPFRLGSAQRYPMLDRPNPDFASPAAVPA